MARTIILLAGPSGSGKSRLARVSDLPQLRLDDFYRDADSPGLPRRHGMIDWDDVSSWNVDAAVTVLHSLATTGRARVPRYNLSTSQAEGTHVVDVTGHRAIVAEGIFATHLLQPCRGAGLTVVPIWLDRPRNLNFARRLLRDLKEHRKPPKVLLRRGWALRAAEPEIRAHAIAAGFRPMSMAGAARLVGRIVTDDDRP